MITRLLTPLFVKGALISMGVLLLALGAQSLRLSAEKGLHATTRAELKAEKERGKAFAAQVRAESEAMQRRATEQARATEARNNQISNEVEHDYQTRLANLRARYERLRRESGAGAGGDPADLPGAPDAAAGPDGAAPRPLPDPFAAEANTLQLEALQRWVRETLMRPQ